MSRKWIWIHGLMRESNHWADFLDLFKSEFPEDKIEFLDLPGAGVRFHESSPLSIRRNLEMIRGQSEIVQNEKVHLLTTSMGSMVALEWIHLFPQEIESCICMNVSAKDCSPYFKRINPLVLAKLIQSINDGGLERREYNILKININLRTDLDQLSKKFSIVYEKNPMSKSNIFRQLFAASQFSLPPPSLDVPVLFLRGMGDQLVAPETTMKVFQKWGGVLKSHPTAGHDLALDAGEWVLFQVKSFLKGL